MSKLVRGIVFLAALIWAGALPLRAEAPPAYEVVVHLSYDEGGRFEFRTPLTRVEARKLRSSPDRERDQYIDMAQAGLAKRQGYFRRLYGEDAAQMQASRVLEVVLLDHRLRKRYSVGPRRRGSRATRSRQ